MKTFWQDVRFGLRMMAKNPSFAVIAVLTLALGIGATTAIWSVFDSLLLHPFPYRFGVTSETKILLVKR